MRRRRFLENLVSAGVLWKSAPGLAAAQTPESPAPDRSVKRVLVMFKCHLDVGFVDTQANIIKRYFDQFFPRAIEVAANLRREGQERYVWTTGSWLVYRYLEQAAAAQRKQMEEAIRAGDIAWHAIPFTWQTEMMDPSLIAGSIGFSQSLDRRFGRITTGAKMTDVPGHTRAIIGPLAENGVKLLDIGVNSASTPPDVPPAFLWKDAAGRSLIMLYHLHEYGGVIRIPGSDLAIDVEMRNDNSGPHTPEEIHKIYADLRTRFPEAQVSASGLSGIADAVEPYRARLPVFTEEIGDTWIYGAASDPLKVARYRELARLRVEWIASRKLKAGDDADLAFLSNFLLEVEHTWGTDTKTWLDFDHYTPRDLASMLEQPKYKVVQYSWQEKRNDLFDAVAALPAPLRAEANERLRSILAVEPEGSGMARLAPGERVETRHFTITLDPHTGAIRSLRSNQTGRDWAGEHRPLALFAYQTLSKADYDRFFGAYLKSKADWAPKDFGKPNIERFGAESRVWQATSAECWHARAADSHRILARLKIADAAAAAKGITAWPEKMYLELILPDAEPVVDCQFSWFGKASNRMPEALWLSFQPAVADPSKWVLDKSGDDVLPFGVVTGGNRAMHAILGGVRYEGPEGKLHIASLDAPVVALGERIPVHFTRRQPDIAKGLHFCLFNNGWGTNYVQWFGEDMRFRFRISV